MDTAPVDDKLQEMVRRIVEAVHPERVYLFGSRARGDARPDSDYDFLLVVRDPAESIATLEFRAYDALGGLGVSKDVIVWGAENFDRLTRFVSTLPGTVVHEGKLLHGP